MSVVLWRNAAWPQGNLQEGIKKELWNRGSRKELCRAVIQLSNEPSEVSSGCCSQHPPLELLSLVHLSGTWNESWVALWGCHILAPCCVQPWIFQPALQKVLLVMQLWQWSSCVLWNPCRRWGNIHGTNLCQVASTHNCNVCNSQAGYSKAGPGLSIETEKQK